MAVGVDARREPGEQAERRARRGGRVAVGLRALVAHGVGIEQVAGLLRHETDVAHQLARFERVRGRGVDGHRAGGRARHADQ